MYSLTRSLKATLLKAPLSSEPVQAGRPSRPRRGSGWRWRSRETPGSRRQRGPTRPTKGQWRAFRIGLAERGVPCLFLSSCWLIVTHHTSHIVPCTDTRRPRATCTRRGVGRAHQRREYGPCSIWVPAAIVVPEPGSLRFWSTQNRLFIAAP